MSNLPESGEEVTGPDQELRTCRLCGESKPLATDYYSFPNGKPYARCKACVCRKAAEQRKPHRDALKAATAERRKNKPPVVPPSSKFCRGCDTEKPIEEFSSPKGRQYHRCYACIRAQNTRYLETHRAEMSRKASAKDKVRRRTDPAFREREKRAREKYAITNPISPEKKAEYQERSRNAYRFDIGVRLKAIASVRKYREENPEAALASRRKHYNENKQKFYARNHNRNARKLGNGGTHTAEEWEALKVQYDYRCLVCGKREPEIQLTRDHIIPVTRGGRNDIQNLQPLCLEHNLRKGTRTIDYRPKVRKPPPGMFSFME